MHRLVFQAPQVDFDNLDSTNIIFLPVFKNTSDIAELNSAIKQIRMEEAILTEANFTIVNNTFNEMKSILRSHQLTTNIKSFSQKSSNIYTQTDTLEQTVFSSSISSNQNSNNFFVEQNNEIKPQEKDPALDLLNEETNKRQLSPKSERMQTFLDSTFNSNTLKRLNILSEWIKKREILRKLPCYYSIYPDSDELILFFHSNAEDITKVNVFCSILKEQFRKNVMALEYSGYSFYKARKTKPHVIKIDAEYFVTFLNQGLGIPLKKITVVGRSIGSGPALHVASKFEFKMVIVISGLVSIRKVVYDRFGILSVFIGKYFDNEKAINLNKSPIIFIHGKNDEIIQVYHSVFLHSKNKSLSKLVLHDDMAHNKFSVIKKVCEPVLEFEASLAPFVESHKDSGILFIKKLFSEK